jgi:hypothetical protein
MECCCVCLKISHWANEVVGPYRKMATGQFHLLHVMIREKPIRMTCTFIEIVAVRAKTVREDNEKSKWTKKGGHKRLLLDASMASPQNIHLFVAIHTEQFAILHWIIALCKFLPS